MFNICIKLTLLAIFSTGCVANQKNGEFILMNQKTIPWWVSMHKEECTPSAYVFHIEERLDLKLALRTAKDQALVNAGMCMKQRDLEMLRIRDLFFAQKRSRAFDIFVFVENLEKNPSH